MPLKWECTLLYMNDEKGASLRQYNTQIVPVTQNVYISCFFWIAKTQNKMKTHTHKLQKLTRSSSGMLVRILYPPRMFARFSVVYGSCASRPAVHVRNTRDRSMCCRTGYSSLETGTGALIYEIWWIFDLVRQSNHVVSVCFQH